LPSSTAVCRAQAEARAFACCIAAWLNRNPVRSLPDRCLVCGDVRYTVLPWEDADEYQALVAALVAEHAPQGPTEEHLVEELAGILWRKRSPSDLMSACGTSDRRGSHSHFADGRGRVHSVGPPKYEMM
jgi:hypothetical protein